MPKGEARFSDFREPVYALLLVQAIGLGLGILTFFAQGFLPSYLTSLANSSGSWAFLAFLSGLFARDARLAAIFGPVTLFTLLLGYMMGADSRGLVTGIGTMLFWGGAAVFVGPLLGIGAYWLRSGRPVLAAIGAGGMSGVLIGEGISSLIRVAATTSTAYWIGEIVFGAALLLVLVLLAIKELRPALLAVGVCAVVAFAFVLIYDASSAIFFYLPI